MSKDNLYMALTLAVGAMIVAFILWSTDTAITAVAHDCRNHTECLKLYENGY